MSCGRKLSMPLEWGRISREASGVSCRVSSSFSSSKRQHGISWETLWRKRALSPMEGRISLLLWSYGGSLRFLSSCAGTLGTRSCFVGEVRSAFLLRGAPRDSSHVAVGMNRASSRVERAPQVSSPFLTQISRFLWSLNRGDRPRLVLRH